MSSGAWPHSCLTHILLPTSLFSLNIPGMFQPQGQYMCYSLFLEISSSRCLLQSFSPSARSSSTCLWSFLYPLCKTRHQTVPSTIPDTIPIHYPFCHFFLLLLFVEYFICLVMWISWGQEFPTVFALCFVNYFWCLHLYLALHPQCHLEQWLVHSKLLINIIWMNEWVNRNIIYSSFSCCLIWGFMERRKRNRTFHLNIDVVKH